MESLSLFWQNTGIAQATWGAIMMVGMGSLLLVLAIRQRVETIFLFSLGFAAVLANMPGSTLAEPGGMLYTLYEVGIRDGMLPALVLLGVGILADFGPLIAMPSLLFVGAAAQLGIFVTFLLALTLANSLGISFNLLQAAVIGIAGGANVPNLVFAADRLAPEMVGIAVVAIHAAVLALPSMQSLLAVLLTSEQERQVVMGALRPVSPWERILFPVMLMVTCLLLLPTIAPLLAPLAFGNLMRESGVIGRVTTGLSPAAHSGLLSLATLLLGLAIGGRLTPERFFSLESLTLFLFALVAFGVGSASAFIMGKWLHRQTAGAVNPLLGAAGIAVVPLAARMVRKLGAENVPPIELPAPMLAYAIGTNMAGLLSAIVTAGILLTLLAGKSW
ncbi:sodium ion-translocating decarboxylase subunit beta [Candidatus Magnetaquicoccus inordinatus]|uniref:sodium ion-translocating decarboxylase subunit beta n=1 Tax=Candidatus Magnetaquicoccus inordinatus TaxID=2496818 RepID=UPI00102C93A8|nr:sodium ion-translocating decarboxylase subunit beta [Candidatus Magnetaquicoccus inordinatus]